MINPEQKISKSLILLKDKKPYSQFENKENKQKLS